MVKHKIKIAGIGTIILISVITALVAFRLNSFQIKADIVPTLVAPVKSAENIIRTNIVVNVSTPPVIGTTARISLINVDPEVVNQLSFRLQYYLEGKSWAPIGLPTKTMPNYTFEQSGITSLHLDLFDINGKKIKGLWLGTWDVRK